MYTLLRYSEYWINFIASSKIQNTAARILTFSRKSCHITPILKELHWLPVTQRIVFKLLMIVYKCTNNIAPSYLSELLSQYSPMRTLCSGNKQLLQEVKSNRNWGDRSFVTSHNKTGQLSVTKKNVIFLLSERAFYYSKMIPLICKLDAALQFYGQI